MKTARQMYGDRVVALCVQYDVSRRFMTNIGLSKFEALPEDARQLYIGMYRTRLLMRTGAATVGMLGLSGKRRRRAADQMAHDLAEKAAETYLDSFCTKVSLETTGDWSDAASADEGDERDDVERAVKYLDLRGLLEHDATRRELVRMKELA